jgi:hypothetical protein
MIAGDAIVHVFDGLIGLAFMALVLWFLTR